MSTAVAKKEAEATAVVDQALAKLYQDDAGEGFQDLKHEDYALPFLKILQGLSPEVQPGQEQYIDGAQQGDLLNTVTGEVIKGQKGVKIVRVAQDKKYIEWKPRKAGGGLVKISDTEEEAVAARTPPLGNPDTDTEIIDTIQIYVLAEGADGFQPAVLSWTKSKAKHARKWNSFAATVTTTKVGIPGPIKQMPISGVVWKLTTKMEKGTKGQYYVPAIDLIGPVTDPALYAAAKQFRAAVFEGAVKVKFVKDDEPEVPGATTDGGMV